MILAAFKYATGNSYSIKNSKQLQQNSSEKPLVIIRPLKLLK